MAGRSLVIATLLMLVLGSALPAPAQEEAADDSREEEEAAAIAGDRVEIEALPGVRLTFGVYRFSGPLEIAGNASGLGITERMSLDAYLEGIAEVPFDWPDEALRAQAVAARTYLAWTLSRGRTSDAQRYGYDICATTRCQVYAGVGVVEGWGGDRWASAVEATSGEILLYQGEPAQAMYSSTSRGRTRNVEDVFTGSTPTPYLVAVDSPNEDSPFVEWGFDLVESDMSALLVEAGILRGSLLGIKTEQTPDGAGTWTVEIEGTEGTTRIGTWDLRTELNAAAASFPDLLPALRPDVERRYPQTILSPSFVITSRLEFVPPRGAPPRVETVYEFRGGGWGHDVGMSQFGAEAMAADGATYADITAHYYGGLRPEDGGAQLPETVVVGLETGVDYLEVGADGPVVVRLDGEVVAEGALGTWRFEQAGSGVRVLPPVGLGRAPTIERVRMVAIDRGPVVLAGWLTASAEVRVTLRSAGRVTALTDWEVRDAGPISWALAGVRPVGPGFGTALVIEARSADGEGSATVGLAIRPE